MTQTTDTSITPKPSPSNPMIILYTGDVPSMKNEHTIRYRKGKPVGIGRSNNVRVFLKNAGQVAEEYVKRQPFGMIKSPQMVGAFVHFGMYVSPKSKHGITSQDLDNVYTSLQETWQNAAIQNDDQIVNYTVGSFPVFSKDLEFALAFLWELDNEKARTDRRYVFDAAFEFYHNFYRPKSIREMIGLVK